MRSTSFRFLLAVLLFVFPFSAHAAIAFDAATNGGSSFTNSPSWSHTTTGANLILLVGCEASSALTSDPVSAVKYNSVSMTLATTSGYHGSAVGGVDLWFLFAPTTGANTVAVTSSGNVWCFSASYSGVKQSGFPDASVVVPYTPSQSTIVTTLTTVADNAWTGQFSANGNGASTNGAGTTIRVHADSAAWAFADSNAAITPPASNTLTVDVPANSAITAIGFSMAPVAAPIAAGPAILLLCGGSLFLKGGSLIVK